MYVINQLNWSLEYCLQIGGYGSKHDGERYELQLCEKYFFYALATLKKECSAEQIFDPSTLEGFGLK